MRKKSKTQATLNFKQLSDSSHKKQGYIVNHSKHKVHLIIRELELSDDEQNKRIQNYMRQIGSAVLTNFNTSRKQSLTNSSNSLTSLRSQEIVIESFT